MTKIGSNTTVPEVFKWLDGSSINPSYWNTDEPNNYAGNSTNLVEACVIINFNGYLNDYKCYLERLFVCEF